MEVVRNAISSLKTTDMANVIGIIQLQEKKGRSTIATNVAGFLSKSHSVVLIDADMTQKTSTFWAQKQKRPNLLLESAFNPQELIAVAEDVMFENDYVVIDASSSLDMTRAILTMSDLCLVPCDQDYPSLLPLLKNPIDEAKMLKPDRDIRLLWNQKSSEVVSDWKVLNATLSSLPIYLEALQSGQIVSDLTSPLAQDEIKRLVHEICEILEAKPKRKVYFRSSRF